MSGDDVGAWEDLLVEERDCWMNQCLDAEGEVERLRKIIAQRDAETVLRSVHEAEVERLRAALRRIANGHCGRWGLIAHEALRPTIDEQRTDAALGLDRSVCLRDVVEALSGGGCVSAALFLKREFGDGGAQPT